ncbi:hypothetical protein B0T25DRAFT_291248 [Lasiosphaeria hispida]|uniref:Uncharacterized protein n=1 Tax=Lasiosphaeria hispida TaxID=260671 RepID=A0AAJ0MB97_9PEZI|nr:hypothetical protein B0T25DRAFT_291248 [Lasiosphaeria hispida]
MQTQRREGNPDWTAAPFGFLASSMLPSCAARTVAQLQLASRVRRGAVGGSLRVLFCAPAAGVCRRRAAQSRHQRISMHVCVHVCEFVCVCARLCMLRCRVCVWLYSQARSAGGAIDGCLLEWCKSGITDHGSRVVARSAKMGARSPESGPRSRRQDVTRMGCARGASPGAIWGIWACLEWSVGLAALACLRQGGVWQDIVHLGLPRSQ